MEREDFDGKDSVSDSRKRSRDLRAFPGTYHMSDYSVDILIRKGHGINKKTYDLLKKFRHNTLIPLLNFYTEPKSNHGRFVIPTVRDSFKHWIRNDGKGLLFAENGSMTTLFRTMIVDICDAVEKLYKEDIFIKNLNSTNLYMAQEVHPRVLILVTEAEEITGALSKGSLWGPVQEIIKWCYLQLCLKPNEHAERYISYLINESFTVKSLKTYPENWDDFTKGEYMLSLIAADQQYIRNGLRVAGFSWPKVNEKLPPELEEIIEYEAEQKRIYSPKIRFDYVNLIRNLYKHFFKLPLWIQRYLGGTREGFLNTLERWTPFIWQDLYDVLGWP